MIISFVLTQKSSLVWLRGLLDGLSPCPTCKLGDVISVTFEPVKIIFPLSSLASGENAEHPLWIWVRRLLESQLKQNIVSNQIIWLALVNDVEILPID